MRVFKSELRRRDEYVAYLPGEPSVVVLTMGVYHNPSVNNANIVRQMERVIESYSRFPKKKTP